MGVQTKAKDLGQEIRKTPEYEELERTGENLKADASAQQLIQDVQEVQRQIDFSQQSGVQPDQEQVARFHDLREQMHANLSVRNFMKAQEEFNSVMKSVNDAISAGITGEVPSDKTDE